jgi:uncharacterized cupredoxin-like copper-binding protein
MRFLPLVIMVLLASTGCGGGSHDSAKNMGMSSSTAAAGGRTIDVEMRDIAYSPSTVAVPAGQPVTFVFHNMGQTEHEAFLGDAAAQADHEQKMASGGMGGMAGAGDEVKVEPGQTASLSHTFKPGETLLIGCHEPGHYAAGMKVAVTVS